MGRHWQDGSVGEGTYQPELGPQNPHGGRREQTQASSPLTLTEVAHGYHPLPAKQTKVQTNKSHRWVTHAIGTSAILLGYHVTRQCFCRGPGCLEQAIINSFHSGLILPEKNLHGPSMCVCVYTKHLLILNLKFILNNSVVYA